MKYKTIVIDPPWKYGIWGKPSLVGRAGEYSKWVDKTIPLPYSSMTVHEIKGLPVRDLAEDNCELFLWTTERYLPFSFEIISGWGFKYCETLVWCKEPKGTGQGGLFTPTTEFIVHGRIGRMPIKKRLDSTWYKIKRQEAHSKKPEFFQDMIELVTDSPRVELFARRSRPGWDAWGNEVVSDLKFI